MHISVISKDAIDETENGFQVRISFITSGSKKRMLAHDRCGYCFVGFVTDALALDGKVEEGLGAKIGLVPEFLFDCRESG